MILAIHSPMFERHFVGSKKKRYSLVGQKEKQTVLCKERLWKYTIARITILHMYLCIESVPIPLDRPECFSNYNFSPLVCVCVYMYIHTHDLSRWRSEKDLSFLVWKSRRETTLHGLAGDTLFSLFLFTLVSGMSLWARVVHRYWPAISQPTPNTFEGSTLLPTCRAFSRVWDRGKT